MKPRLLAACLFLAVWSLPTLHAAQERDRPREGSLKVGDPAPDFALKSPDGKTSFTLSALRGQKPVVLVFASYT